MATTYTITPIKKSNDPFGTMYELTAGQGKTVKPKVYPSLVSVMATIRMREGKDAMFLAELLGNGYMKYVVGKPEEGGPEKLAHIVQEWKGLGNVFVHKAVKPVVNLLQIY